MCVYRHICVNDVYVIQMIHSMYVLEKSGILKSEDSYRNFYFILFYFILFYFIFGVFLPFLGPILWDIEVSRLGVQSEL